VQVGDTVSLRVETRVGPSDLVGTLIGATPDLLTIRRRDGSVVEILAETVRAGRVVPPGPARRIAAAELERITALGWRPVEVERLGDWLLRASGGFTRRGNSVLAVGDPGCEVDEALEAVRRWYGDRGLRPLVQLPSAEAPAGLTELLDAEEWATEAPTSVMSADLGPVLRAADRLVGDGVTVRLADRPDEAWLARFRTDDPGSRTDAAMHLLAGHDRVVFASVDDGDGCAAIARGVVDERWCGLACVDVVPGQRRAGLGRAVSAAVMRWGAHQGARRAYLQVMDDNPPAWRLYEQLGFALHHGYAYRTPRIASTT
jgi:GNAT superfamily N-acetyltransferase